MRKTAIAICLIAIAGTYYLFSSGSPGCSDDKTIELVQKIMKEKILSNPIVLLGTGINPNGSISVDAIRTIEKSTSGSHSCKAQIALQRSADFASRLGATAELNISYTVQITDRGDQIYVSVKLD